MSLTPLQTINIGNYANDGTGDDLRAAFQKVNANFTSLFTDLKVNAAANIGDGEGVFAQKADTTLQFKSIKSGNGVNIVSDSDSITINAGLVTVEDDTSPTLGGDLELNGKTIKTAVGGNIEAPIYNIDIRQLALYIQFLQKDIDLGTFTVPAPGGIDLGYF
jgi:hypothetical protein